MKFKTEDCEEQLKKSPNKLQEIVSRFETLSLNYGIDPTITRVWDGVCGDSGVHEAHRAVDIRDEFEGVFTYSPEQVDTLVNSINASYPRADGKLVCIHHSFKGAPFHVHLQIPIGWV